MRKGQTEKNRKKFDLTFDLHVSICYTKYEDKERGKNKMAKRTIENIKEWAELRVNVNRGGYIELNEGESARQVKRDLKEAFEELGQEVEIGKVERYSKSWESSGGLKKSSKGRKIRVKFIR